MTGTEISVHVHGIPDSEVKLSTDDWLRPTPGLITWLENKIGELDKLRLDTEVAISRTRTVQHHGGVPGRCARTGPVHARHLALVGT